MIIGPKHKPGCKCISGPVISARPTRNQRAQRTVRKFPSFPKRIHSNAPHHLVRIEVISLFACGAITIADACSILKRGRTQIYRYLALYRRGALEEMVGDGRVGRANNAHPAHLRNTVLQIIRAEYGDYGPTLAAEVLAEQHGIELSAETVRQWMLADGLWLANQPKRLKVHRPRTRKRHFGELIQIDGSRHAWLEDRAGVSVLMVLVDDATSRIQYMRMFESESWRAYAEVTKGYILAHGRPVRIFTDKHSSVRLKDGESDYTASLSRLGIAHSHANSAPSKGRVERMNRTLQDRLVKYLRRRNASSIEEANLMLSEFVNSYNSKFAVPAVDQSDMHRPLDDQWNLDEVFCRVSKRVLSRNHTFSFEAQTYVVLGLNPANRPARTLRIEQRLDGSMAVFCGNAKVAFRQPN
ncbi:ISNCY family transposase [Novosphingobium sp.]|uniref:ISNCY family transposase n=1 Tax=Novosphingobium sp. TaxID=1874826 RepID=UPI002639406A|nr:ISNCY family transposase [Novosphingobium sp.]